MKMLFCSLFLIFFASNGLQGQNVDIEYLRLNYEKAVADKDLCRKMMDGVVNKIEEPIYLAYLGSLQAVWANHVINPLSKLSTFKKGKKNLEKAVKMRPKDIEIRFLRLSIQENAPAFLGYYQEIKADKEFIKQNQESITSVSLLQLINKI